MFFRKKSESGVEDNTTSTSYAIIPVYRGKTKSAVGDKIVKIIQKSNFCSNNPFIKRLIVKNIEVCCIVFETSGAQSFKIIFASVPFMVNLLSRTYPKFKAFLEDERVVPYINFFQEIDFERVLSSLCNATIIIQSGIQKCYPIVCVQLGRDVLLFSKNSLHYFFQLFLKGALCVLRYIYEDVPHVLQTLCTKNYTVAKYFVQNLPFMALVSAKQFVLFTLFLQRVATASLKSLKKCVKLICRALINISSDIDVPKLSQDLYSLSKLLTKRIISTSTFKKINYFLLQCFNWFLSHLKTSAPFILKEISSHLRKITPVLKQLSNYLISLLPKLYDCVEKNKDMFIYVYCCIRNWLKLLLQKVKPFSANIYEIFLLTTKNLAGFICCVAPIIKNVLSSICSILRNFLRNRHLKEDVRLIFFKIRKHSPQFYRLAQRVCYTLINILKFYCIVLKRSMSYLILLIQKIVSGLLNLYRESSPFVRPVIWEANYIFHNYSKEVATKTSCCFQRVIPSVWHGLKTVSPVAFHASCEVALTMKTSFNSLYPELLQAALVISPELNKGLFVVLQDSGNAYMEIVRTSYHVSQEAFQVTKCVSEELPLVLRAFSEVTLTTSGAISEVITTSSKAGIRACKDVRSALQTLRSAYDLAELELLTTVNDIALDVKTVVSDHKEILEVTILLKKTGYIVITVTSKQCSSSLKTVSTISFKAAKYSINLIQGMHRFSKYINLIGLPSELISKTLFNLLGFEGPPNRSVKNFIQAICVLCSNVLTTSMSSTSDAFSELMNAVLRSLCHVTPKIWQLSKDTNTTLWFYFCQSASSFWTLLEQTSNLSWQITCEHMPQVWDSCKLASSKIWGVTCELSPVLWKVALPVFPVLWSTHCGVVQYVWELHLQTCSQTWKLVVPLSSDGWERAVQTAPKLWFTLCENSKLSWSNLCDTVELGWNATTKSTSISWNMLHKTVSKSWRYAVRPVTTSTCYNISSAIAKSIKLSYNVCAVQKPRSLFIF